MKPLSVVLLLTSSLVCARAAPGFMLSEKVMQICNATNPDLHPKIQDFIYDGVSVPLSREEKCLLHCVLQNDDYFDDNGYLRNASAYVKLILGFDPEIAKYSDVLMAEIFVIARSARSIADKCERAFVTHHHFYMTITALRMARSIENVTHIKDRIVNTVESGQNVHQETSKQLEEYFEFFDALVKDEATWETMKGDTPPLGHFANLMICVKANGNPIENSQNIKTNVDPLPQKFSPQLREILSPDIFTQTDLFNYLRQKVLKLKYRTRVDMNSDLCSGMIDCLNAKFPAPYVPYAKLLRSLLFCTTQLDVMKIFINSVKESRMPTSHLPQPNTATLDQELSTLFSLDIFSDSNPPSVLLDKLIALPEARLSSIGEQIRFSQDPVVEYYFMYSRNLSKFLMDKSNVKVLKDLRRQITEIQQLELSPPAVEQDNQKYE